MSVEDRLENFILAPSDHAWGDERARDEYYRSTAVAFWWTAPLAMIASLIAAFEGAKLTAIVVLWIVGAAQLAAYRYTARHGVPMNTIARAFLTTQRKLAIIAIAIPYLVVWCALLVDLDHSVLVPTVSGGIAGILAVAVLSVLVARRERRREADEAAADDVFD